VASWQQTSPAILLGHKRSWGAAESLWNWNLAGIAVEDWNPALLRPRRLRLEGCSGTRDVGTKRISYIGDSARASRMRGLMKRDLVVLEGMGERFLVADIDLPELRCPG